MIRHHIQNSILYKLAFNEGLRFAELKPEGLENKLFNYHLKKLIVDKLVEKSGIGVYSLTYQGKLLGANIFQDQLLRASSARSVVFLLIKRKTDSSWLLYKRSTHPLKDRVGFMHINPEVDKSLVDTARENVFSKTNIECNFKILGGGFFRVYEGDVIQSFTNFTLLVSEDAEGILEQRDARAEYFWQQNPDFGNSEMLPNMTTLVGLYEEGKTFFIEKTFMLP